MPLHNEIGNEKLGAIIELTVKFNVAIESHPAAFVRVTGYVPDDKYEFPFQLKGKANAHIVCDVVLAEGCSTVIVIVVSHPAVVHWPVVGVNV